MHKQFFALLKQACTQGHVIWVQYPAAAVASVLLLLLCR
jgi:hypothetical protein